MLNQQQTLYVCYVLCVVCCIEHRNMFAHVSVLEVAIMNPGCCPHHVYIRTTLRRRTIWASSRNTNVFALFPFIFEMHHNKKRKNVVDSTHKSI